MIEADKNGADCPIRGLILRFRRSQSWMWSFNCWQTQLFYFFFFSFPSPPPPSVWHHHHAAGSCYDVEVETWKASKQAPPSDAAPSVRCCCYGYGRPAWCDTREELSIRQGCPSAVNCLTGCQISKIRLPNVWLGENRQCWSLVAAFLCYFKLFFKAQLLHHK